ncbi:sodium-dependent nutrient amino acid transporter 1-like isoform X3 [Venturia canescens]|nr:sodium-dependent nutrient amino acid transporter 1-like isoform X3 [Venturia canescens]
MSVAEGAEEDRPTWGNGIEFLMSCIAMSIGLGNVWRFPFTAYENGGGAFLIPYIIVLFLVGKPFYYLEMILGQFTSKSSVKMWAMNPGFRGVGWAQMFSMLSVGTYYCSLMSVTLFYLISSFKSELPWSSCLPEWGDRCFNSGKTDDDNLTFSSNGSSLRKSSAELYFTKTVLNEKSNIDDGLGWPDWRLTLCLFCAWACIFGVLARGVKSSGKAAYFLALFPYVIMTALLVRAVTLEGAVNGIIFFIKPNWEKLFEPGVWYNAVTQCFFSLSVCFGGVVMYSSYNDFEHNIYRDAMVVTTLDTFTSLMSGFTIFGILGNLAHEMGTDDISTVVRSGTGLAFISYPDAISKFTVLPQVSGLFERFIRSFSRRFIFTVGFFNTFFPHVVRPRYRECDSPGRWDNHNNQRSVSILEALARRPRSFSLRFHRRKCLLHAGRSIRSRPRRFLRRLFHRFCSRHHGDFRYILGVRIGKFSRRRRVHAAAPTHRLLAHLLGPHHTHSTRCYSRIHDRYTHAVDLRRRQLSRERSRRRLDAFCVRSPSNTILDGLLDPRKERFGSEQDVPVSVLTAAELGAAKSFETRSLDSIQRDDEEEKGKTHELQNEAVLCRDDRTRGKIDVKNQWIASSKKFIPNYLRLLPT